MVQKKESFLQDIFSVLNVVLHWEQNSKILI